ncbi:CvpA family protein [Prosthecomicrobium pneumaticum]|uniref:Membrane protein required for colicin V production n=1 Tax=Prosthecomicrobium pneumaticum TaxID=81895 RepID=A0A7W9CTK1_9HYPH|nr:CvpA family protein [Prosthecomicrobium pneumaticum]MBB5751396.1 membrane protein required for colicin V production [Prosthecomicrobium pneumaticum]
MPVTILDGIVLVVVLISAMLAMVRGFVREVLSLASWLAAAAAAFFFHKPIVPLIEPYIENRNIATIAAAAAIFFVVLLVASYIAMRIADFVVDSRVGLVDRSLGFVFGAVRGILLLVIALEFFTWLVPNPPAWVANAMTRPYLDTLGDRLIAALPEDIESSIVERLRGGEEAAPPADAPADAPDQPLPPVETPPPSDRQGLDDLINNDGGTSVGGGVWGNQPAAPATGGGQTNP